MAPSSDNREHFADLLSRRVDERESQLVLGLDPDPMALWPSSAQTHGDGSAAERAAAAVLSHCCALIDAVAPACVAIKPQLACFERLGAPGWTALAGVVEHAKAHGLLVIADGKRGDVPVSAQAYAQALLAQTPTPFGAVKGLEADLCTVNPLMGKDSMEPFVALARANRRGVLALVRTSNEGAKDIEDLKLADGRPMWERLALMIGELGVEGVGQSGLSDVGAVLGATAPAHLARARELMPHAVFLLPGVGAQGGTVESLAAAFSAGRAGGLITASRSIAGAHLLATQDPPDAARAEAERLRAAAWGLC
jgi:orotidine-5'-phosphate decarboxylase